MNRISREEALNGGMACWLYWLSNGMSYKDDLRRFVSALGIKWPIAKSPEGSKDDNSIDVLNLIELVRTKAESFPAYVFNWFEIGRNTIALGQMVCIGRGPEFLDPFRMIYEKLLVDAGIRIDERNLLVKLLLGLSAYSNAEEVQGQFDQIRGRLIDQALSQDQQIMGNTFINNQGIVGAMGTNPVVKNSTFNQEVVKPTFAELPLSPEYANTISCLAQGLATRDVDGLSLSERLEGAKCLATLAEAARLGDSPVEHLAGWRKWADELGTRIEKVVAVLANITTIAEPIAKLLGLSI